HEQKIERRRIFCSVQKSEQRRHSGSVMPVKWIAIKIEATQYHEQDDCRAPDHQAESVSARGFQEKELAEGIACRHYPDPGNDGIQHDKIKLAKMNGASIKNPHRPASTAR